MKKYIVTAGPTREWLDPVRFLTNPSSGKMGVALADAAYSQSNEVEVVLIHGPISKELYCDKPYRSVGIDTTEQLLDAVVSELTDNCTLIMAAAPADYRPVKVSKEKIKKKSETLQVDFVKNPDILKTVASLREQKKYQNLTVVGFAAETVDLEKYALGKLKAKCLDHICVNDVSKPDAGFSSDTNIITIYSKDGRKHVLPKMSKDKLGIEILKIVEST